MKYDIFISYSRKDSAIAEKICDALRRNGISYFIDKKGIRGGAEFPAVLADAIIESKLLLFLASENSYHSKFTNKEITFAFNEKPSNTIIPYIIDGSTLPPALRLVFSDVNWLNIVEHPIETILIDDLLDLLGRKRDLTPTVETPTQTVNELCFSSGYRITNNCVGCGTCAAVCPVEAITEGEIYHIDPDTCIECGSCAEVCPNDAIIPGE